MYDIIVDMLFATITIRPFCIIDYELMERNVGQAKMTGSDENICFFMKKFRELFCSFFAISGDQYILSAIIKTKVFYLFN